MILTIYLWPIFAVALIAMAINHFEQFKLTLAGFGLYGLGYIAAHAFL